MKIKYGLCVCVCVVRVWCVCGGGGSDKTLTTMCFPYRRSHAPNSGDRTPGGQTPGVPATLSPRQPTLVGHRGLPPGTRRPSGRSPKHGAFLRKKGVPSSTPARAQSVPASPWWWWWWCVCVCLVCVVCAWCVCVCFFLVCLCG